MSNILQQWVFHFNPYSQKWLATTREHFPELFSGNKGNVLSSSNIDTLVDLIERTGGNKELIEKLIMQ